MHHTRTVQNCTVWCMYGALHGACMVRVQFYYVLCAIVNHIPC